jgi:hypothetical protein
VSQGRMRRCPRPGLLFCAGALLALALPAFGAPSRKDDLKAKARKDDKRAAVVSPRPILLVANEVIERAMPRFLAPPSDTSRPISVKDGLVGLGAYNPRGGADFGMHAPPRQLFSKVGAGNSLNVDPNTGRSYFTNTP